MKRIYLSPTIRTVKVNTSAMLCASKDGPNVGGNTGIGIGEGDPPTVASSKGYTIFDDNDFDASFED